MKFPLHPQKYILVGGLVTLSIVVLWAGLNPLRRPDNQVMYWLLQEVPLGTPREEVRKIVQIKNWEVLFDRDFGYNVPGFEVEGDKTMDVIIGTYYEFPIPFVTSVEVVFGFNKENVLIDLALRKSTDAP